MAFLFNLHEHTGQDQPETGNKKPETSKKSCGKSGPSWPGGLCHTNPLQATDQLSVVFELTVIILKRAPVNYGSLQFYKTGPPALSGFSSLKIEDRKNEEERRERNQ